MTTLTKAFTGRHARSIVNEMTEALRPHESELPPYPVQSGLTAALRRASAEAGSPEYLNIWAGQGAPLVRRRSAGDFLRSLLQELDADQ